MVKTQPCTLPQTVLQIGAIQFSVLLGAIVKFNDNLSKRTWINMLK
jgi:hypothetical protein